jgi:hypothetical protein
MAAFEFYLQSAKQRKATGDQVTQVGWVRDDSHDATVSSPVAKVRREVFAHFHAVAVRRHSSMRN